MKDRAGLFAGCADTLTAMCVYYVVAGILIMSGRGWGLHLFWLLLCAAGCTWIFAALLKKPRATPFLTAVTGGLFLGCMAVFLLGSKTPPKFGYVFVLAVGGGMAVGLPLYYGLNRPTVQKHLTHLDVLIMALLGLLLCRQALGIDSGTVALMVVVLFMDAAAAVGLRMSDSGSGESADAFRATMIALAAAVAVALAIGLFTLIFSRSGAVTDTVLHGIGSFFAVVGGGIEKFFLRLATLVAHEDSFEAIPLEGEIPSVAGLEGAVSGSEHSGNATAVGAVIVALVLAAAVAVAVVLRKKRFSREADAASPPSVSVVRRSGGTMKTLWEMLLKKLRFRWRAFVLRDTPAGLMIYLERQGKRRHTPRQTGETMSRYIRRMDRSGGLDELAAALDREYYSGREAALPAGKCRELRRYIRASKLQKAAGLAEDSAGKTHVARHDTDKNM